ncbi:MAG: hypothetical protein M5U34_38015 [Chloroflexi bacterium]|nr:hypothetical protein [Chloroflexota bacterium]
MEPVWAAQLGQLRQDLPGFALPPPARLSIGNITQRIQDGIQIRADFEAEMGEVIAGIDDNGQLFGGSSWAKPSANG